MPTPQQIDIAIVIALKEEFAEFYAEIEQASSAIRDDATGSFNYLFERATNRGNRYRCVAAFAGEMGETSAALLAQRLSDRFRPQTFVMLGIAGSLSKDVKLGDVVAATSVDGYLRRAKASQEKVGETVPFELSGEVYRCSADLIKFVSNLPFAYGKAFKKWQSNCSRRLKKLIPQEQIDKLVGEQHLRSEPRVEEGHIASGPVVGAAKEFKDWLRTRDRSYLAIEMEAAGLLTALHEHIESKRTLVLRAISDLGDAAKDELDNIESGALRRYAMQNAIQLLWTLLDVEALPMNTANEQKRTSADSDEVPLGGTSSQFRDLITVGRQLLSEADPATAHKRFNTWVDDVAERLDSLRPTSGLTAEWSSLRESRLVMGSQEFDSRRAWLRFKDAVRERLAWLGNLSNRLQTSKSHADGVPGIKQSREPSSEEKSYNVAAVRELVEAALSDDEFNDLCQGHFPEVFNQFTTGQTKGMRIRLLVEHVSRRRQIDRLLAELEQVNPVALRERSEDLFRE